MDHGVEEEMCEMTSWPPSWNCDVRSKIRLGRSVCIYLRNIAAKFHPDPIWNDGALGFLDQVEERLPQQEEQQD